MIPHIDSTYATASYRILSGHSVAGLFGAELLVSASDAFQAYVLMDPALGWQEMALVDKAEVLAEVGRSPQKVYLRISQNIHQILPR